MNSLSDKQIEQKLVKKVRAAGGICPKFISPGFDGMPDRLALLPDGRMVFAEIKAPGKKPRPLQMSRHRLLRSLGYRVFIIDSEDGIEKMIDEMKGGDAK